MGKQRGIRPDRIPDRAHAPKRFARAQSTKAKKHDRGRGGRSRTSHVTMYEQVSVWSDVERIREMAKSHGVLVRRDLSILRAIKGVVRINHHALFGRHNVERLRQWLARIDERHRMRHRLQQDTRDLFEPHYGQRQIVDGHSP